MDFNKEQRSIIKFGNGFVITLTKELKSMGFKPKDKLWVLFDGEKIIIANDINSALKPFGVDEELWKDFYSMVVKKHGEKNIEVNISRELNNCIQDWLYDIYKFFGFPLFKKKRF